MKETGIARPIDHMGRIVIPKEMRKRLSIFENDELDVSVEGSKIVLKKITPGCTFCGSRTGLSAIKGKYICADCKAELTK